MLVLTNWSLNIATRITFSNNIGDFKYFDIQNGSFVSFFQIHSPSYFFNNY